MDEVISDGAAEDSRGALRGNRNCEFRSDCFLHLRRNGKAARAFRGAKSRNRRRPAHPRGTTTRHATWRRGTPRISDGSDTSIPGAATGTSPAAAPSTSRATRCETPSTSSRRSPRASCWTASWTRDGTTPRRWRAAPRTVTVPTRIRHHRRRVALLGRALGEGGVGTGFVYGAETMVRDALLVIEGAARDAFEGRGRAPAAVRYRRGHAQATRRRQGGGQAARARVPATNAGMGSGRPTTARRRRAG